MKLNSSSSPSQACHCCQSSCNRMSTLPLTLYRMSTLPSHYIECPHCPLHYTECPHCLYVVGFKKGQSLPILPTEQGHGCWALATTQSQIACLSNSAKTSRALGKWQAVCTWKSSALSQDSQMYFHRWHISMDHWKTKSVNLWGATSW